MTTSLIPQNAQTSKNAASVNAASMNPNMLHSVDPDPAVPSISWELSGNTLYISGNGPMPNTDRQNQSLLPWYSLREDLFSVIIGEGITEIGMYSFAGFTSLKKVQFPSSLMRIHGYAFSGCTSLNQVIIPENTEFCYIYEPLQEIRMKRNDTSPQIRSIRFGLQSFRDVPWAIRRWNGFYFKDHILYTCFFSEADVLVIPNDVRTLYDFCLKDMKIRRLEFPDTLEKAGRFLCDKTVADTILLPVSIADPSPYMFGNSLILRVEYRSKAAVSSRTAYQYQGKTMDFGWNCSGKRIILHKGFSLAYSENSGYSCAKALKVRMVQKKAARTEIFPARYDQNIRFIYTDKLDTAKDLLRKMKLGFVLIGVFKEENAVTMVNSFLLHSDHEMLEEYRMYPYTDCESAARFMASRRFVSIEEFSRLFPAVYAGSFRPCTGILRETKPNEMWFVSRLNGFFGGKLELRLLTLYLKENKACRLLFQEEISRRLSEKNRQLLESFMNPL